MGGRRQAPHPPSQTESQEVKLKEKRVLPPLTQGLSPFEDDVRKEKAGLKGNTEESQIHA